MTVTPHPLLGTTLDGRYQLQSLLGAGGMGAVFVAFDEQTQETLALKLLSNADPSAGALPQALEQRLQREVHLLSSLAQSGPEANARIIRLYEWGRDPSAGLFYTMEWLQEGQTLMDYVGANKPSLSQCLAILRELLLGIDVLHQQHIVHRDLKPSNVLCWDAPKGPRVKLIDLGIARWFSDVVRTHMTVETAPGSLLGSPAYMAPEMWRNEDVDARTDVYQVGILAYQLLTGELPFAGTPHQLMFQHLHGFLPEVATQLQQSAPGVPKATLVQLDLLLQQATHVNPAERPADAQVMVAALDSLVWEKHTAPGELPTASYAADDISPLENHAPLAAPHDEPGGGQGAGLPSDSVGLVADEMLAAPTRGGLRWLLVGGALGVTFLLLLWWHFGANTIDDTDVSTSAAKRLRATRPRTRRPKPRVPKSSPRRPSVASRRLLPRRGRVRRRVRRRRVRPRKAPRTRARNTSGLGKPGLGDTLLVP